MSIEGNSSYIPEINIEFFSEKLGVPHSPEIEQIIHSLWSVCVLKKSKPVDVTSSDFLERLKNRLQAEENIKPILSLRRGLI